KFEDPNEISIKDLQNLPIINIIIPAGKEGKEFQECLNSIVKLKYPELKVIVNAGGNEETINIANSFKKYDNFTILYQKSGKDRAALGKIRALNECIDHVLEGILYLIDADCYITDDLLLRMIYPIINQEENVVIGAGLRPLKSQENKDLVKYLQISTNQFFKEKFTRYNKRMISGANTTIKYEVMKQIGRFNENRDIAEDVSRGLDILSKGFNIFSLTDYRSCIYTDFPKTFKELFEQRKRQIENALINSFRNKRIKYLLRFLVLLLGSFYVLVFPLFLIFHYGLFFMGVYILLFMYLKKIRYYIFFIRSVEEKYYSKFHMKFFIKILFYIYIQMVSTIFIPFDLILYKKKLRKEK
ncbi:MAG: glycosyltransferase, partial [Candidatus Hodarchaeota archaeon]